MVNKVEVSSKTIFFTIASILGLWFLYQIRGILVILFISFILMTAINPIVRKSKKIKIPTAITVLLIYILIITLISAAVASLIPAVVQQSKSLIDSLPKIIDQIEGYFKINATDGLISSQINSIPSNILKIAAGAFSNTVNILTVFFITYYLILDRDKLHIYLVKFFGNNSAEEKSEKLISEMENQVGGWIRGEIVLMLVIGIMTYIGVSLLKLPYALPLAILAGLLEIIPGIGPTVAAVPAVLVGLSISPVTGIGTTALYILIQQLENNLIVPQVMKKAIGTHPIVTLVVIFIGLTLGGALGAILSMPIFLTIRSAYKILG